MKRFVGAGVLLFSSATGIAQDSPPPATVSIEVPSNNSLETEPTACLAETAEISSISEKYAAEQKAIDDDGHAAGTHHVDFDVTFREREFLFDVPSITMKAKKLVLDLPQVTMKNKTFSFDFIETIMINKKVGQYPQITCDWRGCKVKWKDIITKVPEIRRERRQFVTSVPEVKFARTEVVTNIPQTKMDRQRWVANIPEFKMKSPIPSSDPTPEQKKLEERAELLAAKINLEIGEGTGRLYNCLRTDLVLKRSAIAVQFDETLVQIDAGIAATRAAGADPTMLEADGGKVNLLQQREELISLRAKALADLDKAIAEIDKEQNKTFIKEGDEIVA